MPIPDAGSAVRAPSWLERRVASHGRVLRVIEVPDSGDTPILFIHGSPGSWDGWEAYLRAPELAGVGPRLAPDRPGYGGSGAGLMVPDLRLQAEMLADVIPPGQRAIVVGHSLGAPIAAWIARDHPERVCGIVLVAGSVVPGYERPRWYNHLAALRLVRPFLPAALRWSNDEMMPLASELQRLEPEWARLTVPVAVLQGGRDRLVDPRSVEWLLRRLPAALTRVDVVADEGHLMLWTDPRRVMADIRCVQARSTE